ncbi:MAG TPA: carboxypeptidase-like regulatory domain-containing protein, partial [Vicinamibacteria bacterium]
MNVSSRCTLAFALTSLLSAGALAQDSATAVLVGQVKDASRGPVAGARVAATREGTGVVREATTGAGGNYVIPSLGPGTYAVSIEAAGFATRTFSRVRLEVGNRVTVDAVLDVAGQAEVVDVEEVGGIEATSAVVGGVVSSSAIDNLPLNGRNFLELAFLVPGNTPAPNFDPTKTNSIAVSSAGQLGRGGNITIDGQDNNDDAVGGPLANLPQDAVQEFQIATNRFSADQGRSAASAINVVTKSGSDQVRGSASLFLRHDALQGLPATFDRSSGQEPSFDRQQYSVAVGGPLVKGKAWWFGAVEYRKQDAVAQVGERDVATRTIRRNLAAAPLDDILATGRIDVEASTRDTLSLRYVFEDAEDTGASTLDRAIGSASFRQTSTNKYNMGLA